MNIKIFHTADVHLGAKFNFLGSKAELQRKQLEETFAGIVEEAITKEVQIFLVAGDLFDSPYPSTICVNFVKTQIDKLLKAGIYTAIIAGNHDYLASNSVYNSGILSEISRQYLKIFSKPDLDAWEIPELQTVIIGAGLDHPKNSVNITGLNEIVSKYKDMLTIGLFHGSIDIARYNKYNLLSPEQLKKVKMDYMALGDWHGQLEISKIPPIYYSGSPEIIASEQKNAGKYLVIECGPNKKISITSQTSGKRVIKNLTIDIEKFKTQEELELEIKKIADKDCILNVLLQGFTTLDSHFQFAELAELLEGEFFTIKFKDETKIRLDEKTLAQYPKELLIGKYIATVIKNGKEMEIPEEIINKVLQIGVNLLQEKD